MTREEAIRGLKADYCGNRIICELYPDQCNREDCEIWLAIKALAEQPIRVLETQPDGDAVSRKDAIRIVDSIDTWQAGWRGNAIESLKALPSAQPEQGDFEKQLHDMFDHIWNCEIDQPVFQDTVGDLMRAVIEAHYRAPQPDITPDGTLTVSIDADIANVGRILLSQAGTQYGGLYYKDAQPEVIMCKDCKHYRKERGWNCIEYTVCAISPIHTVIRKPDDFCSRAERKDDE